MTWKGFPSMGEDTPWPGAWCYGVDFAGAGEGVRVIAVRLGNGDIKYGTAWIGPVELTEASAIWLEKWAQRALAFDGGYVHLFPADGDASKELAESTVEEEEPA